MMFFLSLGGQIPGELRKQVWDLIGYEKTEKEVKEKLEVFKLTNTPYWPHDFGDDNCVEEKKSR